jgi:hypothetical protein
MNASNSVLIASQMRLTVDFDMVAECLGERRFHIAHRQAAHKAGDDERFQGIGTGHRLVEQARRELLRCAAQFRTLERHGPGGRLDRQGMVAVARSVARLQGALAAFVPVSTQELGDLGFEDGLEQQPGAQPSDVLQGVGQVTPVAAEQVVDLITDAVSRRYSRGHRCRSLCRSLLGWLSAAEEAYARRHLHHTWDATAKTWSKSTFASSGP